MQISNVRLGFATNSSSSHSVVFIPKGGLSEYTYDYGHYGWENFILTSKDQKLAYLAAQLGCTLEEQLGGELTVIVLKELFGVEWDDSWYVDHQSVFNWPTKRNGHIDWDFVKAVRDFMLRDDVAVLGGNDNGDDMDDTQKVCGSNVLPLDNYRSMWIMRSDDWWTLFNTETGAKVRLSFNPTQPELKRSAAPELVDMHLTDFCNFGCGFCYQGSTAEGKHANGSDVSRYLYDLSEMGTFEVTFGGGEPTSHPNFEGILQQTRKYGMVPNFTTKVFPENWSQSLVKTVRETCGGFAVSVTHGGAVHTLKEQAVKYDLKDKVHAHFVVGTASYHTLEGVVRACRDEGVPLTLLGFKTTGRGKTYRADPNPIRAESLKDARLVSVDTAFVEQYQPLLDEQGVSRLLTVPGEGRFSMYLDAVNNKAGISSYHPETKLEIKENLQEMWHKLGEFIK